MATSRAPLKDSVDPAKLGLVTKEYALAEIERHRPIKALINPKKVLDLLTTDQIFNYLKYIRGVEVEEKRHTDSRGGA